MNLEGIDPHGAWEEYVPMEESPWDLKAAAHLYRRAGFGASRKELQTAVAGSPAEAVDGLLNVAAEPDSFRRQSDQLARAALAGGNVERLSAWWAHRMLTTPVQLLEKMTLFWHGHFATSAARVADGELMLQQNRLLRFLAIGDFSKLLLNISRDPAMLIYLDSVTNRKAHPNENYAREIMELFCLGEGQYTERDIRELARCFTGWEVRRKKFRFNRYQHDRGSKSILGRSGEFGGEDGVQIVVSQKAAPEFIVRKLIHYFVLDEPAVSPALIRPLADELRAGGMQIAPTLRRILSSRFFFSRHAVGRKIRSPVELAVGFLRSLEGSCNSFELAASLRILGQGLFYPPSVKGWDGGRTWINSSTLLGRSNLIRHFLESNQSRFGRQPLQEYLKSQGVRSGEDIIHWFETGLFAVSIPDAARERLASLLKGDLNSPEQFKTMFHALCTLPEFQLG